VRYRTDGLAASSEATLREGAAWDSFSRWTHHPYPKYSNQGGLLLHEFLNRNRNTLIERCGLKAAQRSPKPIDKQLAYGVPLFLDQIIKTLQVELTSEPMQSRKVSGPAGGGISATSEIGAAARLHAHELLQHGYTIDRVVHDYGDLCQAITDLAFETHIPIQVDEFRTLNRCLDNAIADSVTEYAYERDRLVADRGADGFPERLGAFAHELRNLIATAAHALAAVRTGHVGLSGPTGGVLDRCLIGLSTLVDRSFAEVRLTAALPVRGQLISVAHFVADVQSSATLEAESRGCHLTVSSVQPDLAVDADREMLFSAVNNLLQNAFKFTRHGTEVSLNAYANADRIFIDVEDHCGGLPPGDPEHLFRPFTQSGEDKSGIGLGLSICRRSVQANRGVLSVRDVPGTGCVFTINLPRYQFSEESSRV
jgi:signal transduction histidine kinase